MSYPDWGWDMWDLGNQYVAIGETSGLIPLVSFLAVIMFGFGYLGQTRKRSEGNWKQGFFIWAIGSSLFANVVGFLGISYFDQTIVAWYTLLAMISTLTAGRAAHGMKHSPLSSREAQLVSTFDPAPHLRFHSSPPVL